MRSKELRVKLLYEILPEATRVLNIVSRLDVTKASILDLSRTELEKITSGCDAVVSCLGYNLNFKEV